MVIRARKAQSHGEGDKRAVGEGRQGSYAAFFSVLEGAAAGAITMVGLAWALMPARAAASSSSSSSVQPPAEQLETDIYLTPTVREVLGSMHSIELQLMAFIGVFSASGLVPLVDLVFPIFVTIYTFLLSRFAFPSYPMQASRMEVFHGSRRFQLFVVLGTVVGFFLPLAYVLGGFSRGDQGAVRAATPHLFLISAQMLSELFISGHSFISPPVRVILTLLYAARRLFTLSDWIVEAFSDSPPAYPAQPKAHDTLWMWFGRWLVVANFVYCNINMFCFLIPRFLLRAFERYIMAKSAYDASYHIQPAPNSKDPTDEKKDKSKEMQNVQELLKDQKNKGKEILQDKGKEKESEKDKIKDAQNIQSSIKDLKDVKTKEKDKEKDKRVL